MGSGISGKYQGTFYYNAYQDIQKVSETSPFGDNNRSSIEVNAFKAREKFGLDEKGFFANETKNINIREFKSVDPIGDSKELYSILSDGGVKEPLLNGRGVRARLDDGTWITYRIVTNTPNSPAVDINVSGSQIVASQKIHFVKG